MFIDSHGFAAKVKVDAKGESADAKVGLGINQGQFLTVRSPLVKILLEPWAVLL